jgi:hypothetical protein
MMTTEKQAVLSVQIRSAVEAYVKHLNMLANGEYKFTAEDGRKFFKIVKHYGAHGNRSVHSFVDKSTGGLYKAASWAQAAKGVRFDLVNEFTKVTQVADIHGGYLYKNR